jgi:hypothetical protein
MFQFPANPLLGQVFSPVPGVQYKWNGTGWSPFAVGFLNKDDTDLLYVPLTQRGAANGVATLDAAAKVPIAQLLTDVANGLAVLDAGVKIAMARLHAAEANGLATLDGTIKVPMAQLHGGEANGLATLDNTGKVPLAQLQAMSALLAGSIVFRQSVGGGMLRANGQVVAKAIYPDLWAYAQTVLTADQVTNPGLYRNVDADNFALPNLDGLFIRGAGGAAAAVGARQADDNKSHAHGVNDPGHQHNVQLVARTGTAGSQMDGAWNGGATATTLNGTGVTIQATGGAESRPVNVALIPCIITGRIA